MIHLTRTRTKYINFDSLLQISITDFQYLIIYHMLRFYMCLYIFFVNSRTTIYFKMPLQKSPSPTSSSCSRVWIKYYIVVHFPDRTIPS